MPEEKKKSMAFWLWERVWGYFQITCITCVAIFHFIFILFILPIRPFSQKYFQQALTFSLLFTVPGFACVPFSWTGMKVTSSNFGRFKQRVNHDQLVIANHSARIDWMTGMYVSTYFNQRVSFVTEAFLIFMPFVGWHRYLSEDMFVYRSFLRDADRLSANIQQFKAANVKRWLFLCPEGYIADFSKFDKEYIENCQAFCKSENLDPFEMVLTPRYKGITIFKQLLQDGKETAPCISATFNYVYNGQCAVKPLFRDDRLIPDLWTIATGRLECHMHVRAFELSSDPAEMKKQLLFDYSIKDKVLKQFYETGKQTAGLPGKTVKDSPAGWEPCFDPDLPIYEIDHSVDKVTHERGWHKKRIVTLDEVVYDDPDRFFTQELPTLHWKMNASLIGQFYAIYLIAKFVGLQNWVLPAFLLLYFSIGLSHFLGEMIANGQSRESIPFEGLVKAIMLRIYGIEGKDETQTSAKISHVKNE